MSKLTKFIFWLCLILTVISTHVYVATEFYNRGHEIGYKSGVGEAAYYMYAVCHKGGNLYFYGSDISYYCAKAVEL